MKNPSLPEALLLALLLSAGAEAGSAAPSLRPLQPLIDATATGDTLHLAPGLYTAARISSRMVLVGSGAATVIDGGGTGHTLTIEAGATTVSDLTVRNSGRDVTFKDSGIWIAASAPGVRIQRVRIEQCGFGIWVDGAERPQIIDNIVVGRDDDPMVSNLGNGIHLFKVKSGLISGNLIALGRDGIYISNSTDCRIVGNRIGRTRFAIHYMYSHDNEVIDNLADSSSVGLALMYSKELLVAGNVVRHAHNHGIMLRNLYQSRITENFTTGNKDGFSFSGCSYDTLVHNRVIGNQIGIVVSDSRDNVVTDNAFERNQTQLDFQDNVDIHWGGNGRGNYWSDYTGWDRNADGIGDTHHHPADIISYLVGRYPVTRLIMHSPAMVMLQALEARFPVIRPPGVVEESPLMARPMPLRTTDG